MTLGSKWPCQRGYLIVHTFLNTGLFHFQNLSGPGLKYLDSSTVYVNKNVIGVVSLNTTLILRTHRIN